MNTRGLLYSLLVLFISIASVFAQTIDGNLVGTVTDATGAVVGQADLTLENVATGVKYTTKSNDEGQYRFNNVPVGTYTLTTSRSGFTTSSVRNINVELARTNTVNVSLAVGAVSTTVDVVEAPPAIDTTTAQVTTQFETRAALQLPQSANGALGVLNLSLLGAGVASSGGVGYGTGPSVGGQRPTNNNFMIEGVDNNDKSVTGRVVDISNEAVSSFTLLQNQYSPEFGHSSGGIFNTIIKSGTNDFHGSIYEYFQNRNLNAIDIAFARGQDNPENPRYDNNRLGATAGGAIVKNKLFYFGNFEYNPIGLAGTTAGEVNAPTAEGLQRLGQIPGLNANALSILKQYVPAAGSAVDTTRVAGVDIPIGVLQISRPSFSNQYNWLVTTDYNATDNDKLQFRFVNNRFSGIDTAAALPVFFMPLPFRAYLTSLTYFRNFTPNLINELRASYNRSWNDYPVPEFQYPGLDQFPNIRIDDLGLNIGPNENAPQNGFQNTYQLVNNMTWIRGGHTLKFGYDGRKVIAPSFFVQRFRGDYTYASLERWLRDYTPDFAERSAGGFPFAGDLMSHYGFLNDEWRVTRKLSLNLGLRYEWVDVPYGSKLQRLNQAASVPGVVEFNQPKSQKNNWAPRVGFAYTPWDGGNTVFRGGFGIAYDQVYQNLGINSLPPQFFSTRNAEPDPVNPDVPGFLAGGGLSGAAAPANATPAELRDATSSYIPEQIRPYSITWNFGIQHVFAQNYTLEVRYLGTRGVKLPVQTRLNRAARATVDRSLKTYLQRPSQSELDALTLTLDDLNALPSNIWASAGFGSNVTAFMPWGNSVYHGLATQLNRRFSNGLQFQAAHTWSHNIDDSTAALFSTVIAPRRPQDFLNYRQERASSALDRRHRFTFTGIWEMPWLKNADSWALRSLIGGWMISGTYTAESPMMGTVQSGIDSNLNGDNAGDRAVVNPAGEERVGSGVTALRNTRGQVVGYLANNPNARYIVAGAGVFPNGGRNTLPLRGINNFDLSFSKWIPIKGDRVRFQFRADMYNALNHPQFTPGSINTIAAVSQTSTRAYLIPNNADFGNPETAFGSNPRVIQLVGRIQW